MKTTYADEELQAAIDNAILLFGRENGMSWEQLAPNRLSIAKAFLEKLEPATPHKPVPVGYTLLQDGASEFEKLPESAMWLVKDGFSEWKTDSWFINNQVTELAQSQNWYAVPTPDPYAELKKAHAEGKAIEVFVKDDEYGPDRWSLKENNSWSLPPESYRIKPEPPTFEAHGKTWTRHTPGDAMPCDGAVMVQALLGDNTFATQPAEDWSWKHRDSKYDIIGWRYADEQPNPLVAGACAKCGSDVFHREGKAGEFDHECPKEMAEPQAPSWTPAVGDVVQLKSGSPKMTVHFVDSKNGGCVTFSNTGEFTFATLPLACLTIAKP